MPNSPDSSLPDYSGEQVPQEHWSAPPESSYPPQEYAPQAQGYPPYPPQPQAYPGQVQGYPPQPQGYPPQPQGYAPQPQGYPGQPQGCDPSFAPMPTDSSTALASGKKRRWGLIVTLLLTVIALVVAGVFFIPRFFGSGSLASSENGPYVVPSDEWADGYKEAWSYSLDEREAIIALSSDMFFTESSGDRGAIIRGYSLNEAEAPEQKWEYTIIKGREPEGVILADRKLYLQASDDLSKITVVDTLTGEGTDHVFPHPDDIQGGPTDILFTPSAQIVCYSEAFDGTTANVSFSAMDFQRFGNECIAFGYDQQVKWKLSQEELVREDLRDTHIGFVDWEIGKVITLEKAGLEVKGPAPRWTTRIHLLPSGEGYFALALQRANHSPAIQVWDLDGAQIETLPLKVSHDSEPRSLESFLFSIAHTQGFNIEDLREFVETYNDDPGRALQKLDWYPDEQHHGQIVLRTIGGDSATVELSGPTHISGIRKMTSPQEKVVAFQLRFSEINITVLGLLDSTDQEAMGTKHTNEGTLVLFLPRTDLILENNFHSGELRALVPANH